MPQTDPLHPEVSPLWREDFQRFTATRIITAEFDPLRDEGEALYQRFREQGVDCTCQRYLGVIHGFFQLAEVESSGTKRNAGCCTARHKFYSSKTCLINIVFSSCKLNCVALFCFQVENLVMELHRACYQPKTF